MLSYLVYISYRKLSDNANEIEEILKSALKNNPSHEITGVLLYSTHKFIQYLEGGYEDVMWLYEKIKQDNRHEYMVLLSVGNIETRVFPNWYMGNKHLPSDEVDFLTDINAQDKITLKKLLKGEEHDAQKIQKIFQKFF
ncbi:MAG: BLUF domain-containing protein [Cytophagales bacterium]|nr:MAG: BLUF domain-containing protein [Cytophagales bacterium]